jgi:hypothetical protein
MIARRSRLGFFLAAALMLGTATVPPSMALVAATGNAPAGHHHGDSHAPGKHTTNNCCDLCWTACGTAPGVSARATLPVVQFIAIPASPLANGGLQTARPVPHRLPFAQGPPASLS